MNRGRDEDDYDAPEVGFDPRDSRGRVLREVSACAAPRVALVLTPEQAVSVLEDMLAQDTAEPYSRFLDDERAAVRMALAALKRGT